MVEIYDELDGMIPIGIDLMHATHKEISYIREAYADLKKRKYPNGKFPKLF